MIHHKALELFWNKSVVGCATVSSNGTFREVNERFCEIVEYSQVELVGKNFRDITLPSDTLADIEMTRRVEKGELDHYRMVKTYIKKSGFPVLVELVVYPIKNDDNTFDYFLTQVIPRIDIMTMAQAKEIHVDAWVLISQFIRQNKRLLLGFITGVTAVLSAVAIGIAKVLALL